MFKSIAHVLPSERVTNERVLELILDASASSFKGEQAELREAVSQLFESAGTQVRYHRARGETALDPSG